MAAEHGRELPDSAATNVLTVGEMPGSYGPSSDNL